MIITTIDAVPGRQIAEVLGMCRGSGMKGAKTILSSFSDANHINTMLKDVTSAEELAIINLTAAASELGADAVIGTQIASTALEDERNLKYVITIYGTAVKLT